jgi:hypothetical protein
MTWHQELDYKAPAVDLSCHRRLWLLTASGTSWMASVLHLVLTAKGREQTSNGEKRGQTNQKNKTLIPNTSVQIHTCAPEHQIHRQGYKTDSDEETRGDTNTRPRIRVSQTTRERVVACQRGQGRRRSVRSINGWYGLIDVCL